jgi:hypothetical protein
MPHKPQQDASRALHHIIARGIKRRTLFETTLIAKNLLIRLDRIVKDSDTYCLTET